ncbi:MAG: DUF2269 family protein [Actinomycetota bacterium]
MGDLVTTLHVVAAVFIVGPMAILPMIGLQSIRTGNAPTLLRLAKSTNLFALLSIIVFLLGFGALAVADAKERWSITTPWIMTSIILYLVAASLSLFVTAPVMRAKAHSLEQEPDTGVAHGARAYRMIAAGSGLSSLALVAVVVLMVWKP